MVCSYAFVLWRGMIISTVIHCMSPLRDVSLFFTPSVTLVGCGVRETATDEQCGDLTAALWTAT